MGAVSSATLIVLGVDLDPDRVTELLDLAPSQAWRKGQNKSITGYDGETRSYDGIYEWGGWKLWLPEEMRAMPLLSQLMHWSQILKERAAEVLELKEQGFTLELNCSVSGRVYTVQVPSALQASLGCLGVDLDLTFYSHRPKVRTKRRKPPQPDMGPVLEVPVNEL